MFNDHLTSFQGWAEDDLNYFRQRAAEEAARAQEAENPVVAAIHSQLAAAYCIRAGSAGTVNHDRKVAAKA